MKINLHLYLCRALLCVPLFLLVAVCSPAMAQSFEQVDAGFAHVCALDTSGQVECTTTPIATRFLPPEDLPLMSAIAVGQQHSCGITLDGGVECWGVDAFGALQVPDFDAPVVTLSAGFNHTCAINENNQVQCWGLNSNEQLNVPDVPGGFVEVDAGREATCGIDTVGDIHCWSNVGAFVFDQPLEGPFIDLDVSIFHACGLTANGDIDCFVSQALRNLNPPTNGPYTDLTVTPTAICGLGMDQLLDCSFASPTSFTLDTQADQYPLDVAFSSIESSTITFGGVPICGVRAESGTVSCFGDGPQDGNLPPPPGAPSMAGSVNASNITLQLAASVYSPTQVELFWNRLPSAFPPLSVEVFRDDELVATTQNNASFFFNGDVGDNDEVSYRVRTVDDAGNSGPLSNEILVNSVTREVGQSQAVDNPRADSLLQITNISSTFFGGSADGSGTQIFLFWEVDNPENVAIAGYEFRLNDRLIDFVQQEVFAGEIDTNGQCNVFSIAAIAEDGEILEFSSISLNTNTRRVFRCPE